MKALPMAMLATAVLASACSAPRSTTASGGPAADASPLAGWYLEQGGGAYFQPCGDPRRLAVDSPALRDHARAFGLETGTPVYARLSGTVDGAVLRVRDVLQFGSPTPVADCAMTGTIIQ